MAEQNKPSTILADIVTDEVSLVEAGANLKPRFPVMKAEGMDAMQNLLVSVLGATGKTDSFIRLEKLLETDAIPEDAQTAVLAALKLLESFSDIVPVAEALDALKRASGQVAEQGEKVEQAETPADETEGDELTKSLGPLSAPAREAFLQVMKSNRELQAELGAEVAKRKRMEFVELAKDRLGNIPGYPVEQIADIILETKGRDHALGLKVEKALEAASNGMRAGALLVPVGKVASEAAEVDPMAKIEALAKSLQKRIPALTKEKAITQVLLENPKLHRDYDAQRANKGA